MQQMIKGLRWSDLVRLRLLRSEVADTSIERREGPRSSATTIIYGPRALVSLWIDQVRYQTTSTGYLDADTMIS